jgi:thiamine biosynthesis lipoprotein
VVGLAATLASTRTAGAREAAESEVTASAGQTSTQDQHDAASTDDAIVEVHFAMGTPVAITARGDERERTRAAMRAAYREIRRLESILTAWDPDSETSRLNRDAGGAPHEVAPELSAVVDAATRLSRETDGGFSILVGPIVDAWRAGEPGTPEPAVLARATMLARPDDLVLHGRRVELRRAGMRLDLDGIAKGFAADRALDVLRAHGVRAAIVNLGGSSMAAFGDAGDGARGWPVEVPSSAASDTITVRLVDEALSASSSRTTAADDGLARKRVIVDPRTGGRIDRDVTAIVVHGSATDAEAWSKALVVRGGRDAALLVEHGAQAMLLDGSDGPLCTARFHNRPGDCKVLRPAAASSARPRHGQERLGG